MCHSRVVEDFASELRVTGGDKHKFEWLPRLLEQAFELGLGDVVRTAVLCFKHKAVALVVHVVVLFSNSLHTVLDAVA